MTLCLGNDPGQSNWAFNQFDAALGKLLEINQKEFNQAVERGLAGLAGFDVSAPLAALAVAVLALVGLWPRLREYGL